MAGGVTGRGSDSFFWLDICETGMRLHVLHPHEHIKYCKYISQRQFGNEIDWMSY